MMSSTKRTSATAVANQAAAARVVARALGEGVAVPWLFGGMSGRGGSGGAPAPGLFGGALASGLTAPMVLGGFAASPSRSGEVSDVMAASSDLWRGSALESECSGPARQGWISLAAPPQRR